MRLAMSLVCAVLVLAGLAGPAAAGRPVLLVIDVQNAYLPFMDATGIANAFEQINNAIELFRSRELPVVRIYHISPEGWPPLEGGGFRFAHDVAISEEDPMIVKNHPDAFKKTELTETLEGLDCDAVYLCGLSATGCVLATYFGGLARDLPTHMIKEALISPESRLTDAVEEITRALDIDAVARRLDDAAH